MMPTMPPGGSLKLEILDQQPVAEALGQPVRLDHQVAQPRARWDHDLPRLRRLVARLVEQVLIGRDARLGLGAARLRALPDPLLLARQCPLPALVLALLLLEALALLLEPAGVVALVGDALAAIELEDPARHIVQEVAVVGDGHDGALVLGQEPLQPRHRFGVQMVGRLVEQQHVGVGEQQPAQATRRRSPPESVVTSASPGGQRSASMAMSMVRSSSQPLQASICSCSSACSVKQRVHVGVGVGEPVGDLVEPVEQVLGGADALHDVAQHVLVGVELRLLRQVADLDAGGGPGLAVDVLVHAGHDLEQGRLAGAVDAEHADLGAGQERQRDVLHDLPAAGIDLGDVLHHVDVLIRGHARSFRAATAAPQGDWVGRLLDARVPSMAAPGCHRRRAKWILGRHARLA